MNITPQPSTIHSIPPLDAARAKQLAARRKMQALPNPTSSPVQTRLIASLPNVNWHDHYLMRVAK